MTTNPASYEELRAELEALKLENESLKMKYMDEYAGQKNAELERDKQLYFANALNRIADISITTNNSEEILENTNRILGETLRVDRSVIFDVSFEANRLVALCEWLSEEHSGITSTKGVFPLDRFRACVTKMKETESFLESHSNAVDENFNEERLFTLLHVQLNIKSLLWYPFAFDDHGFYVFAMNQVLEHRKWTQEDLGFIESVAKQVNLALIKIKLRESEKKYRLLIDSANEAIVVVQGGMLKLANPITRMMTGYSQYELETIPFTGFIHPDDRDIIADRHKRRLLGEVFPNYYILRLVNKDSTIRWVYMNAVLIDWEGHPATLNFLTDITELKLTEKALRKSNEKWEAIISASPDGIGIVSLDGKLQYLSDKLVKMYGYSLREKDDLIGRSVLDFIHESDRENLAVNLQKLLERESDYKVREYMAVRKDNSQFYISINYTVLLDSENNPASILFVERDTTERKLAEEKIKKTNQELEKINTEKDKFFSIIAHDLRSPFQGLIGLTEIMASDYSNLSPAQIAKYNTSIHRLVINLYTLLENLLEWSQLQKGTILFTPREVNLSDIILQSIETIKQRAIQKQITIRSAIPLSQKVYADERMLNSVLRNLLSNAVKFTGKGGTIIGEARESDDGSVEIAVTDSGVGMSKEAIGRLFKIGEKVSTLGTDNEPSTGLGLLLCKEFVEKHGGTIWVESEEGKGSTFFFTLRTFRQ